MKSFVRQLLPALLIVPLRRFTAAVIMEIAYGHKVVSDDDLYVQLAQEVNDSVAVMGGAAILDLLPFRESLNSLDRTCIHSDV